MRFPTRKNLPKCKCKSFTWERLATVNLIEFCPCCNSANKGKNKGETSKVIKSAVLQKV